MKIYELAFFCATEWARMSAEVVAESANQAKELLIQSGTVCVFKRGYHNGDAVQAPNSVKMDWIDVMGEREMPQKGVLFVRRYYS